MQEFEAYVVSPSNMYVGFVPLEETLKEDDVCENFMLFQPFFHSLAKGFGGEAYERQLGRECHRDCQ
jgi:hypothetical protein